MKTIFTNTTFNFKKRTMKPRNYWTPERLKIEAKKYKSRCDFALGSKGAYEAARVAMILDTLCHHMKGRYEK